MKTFQAVILGFTLGLCFAGLLYDALVEQPDPHKCVPVGHDWSLDPCVKHPHDSKNCLGCETRRIIERHFDLIRDEVGTLAIPSDPNQPPQFGVPLKPAK